MIFKLRYKQIYQLKTTYKETEIIRTSLLEYLLRKRSLVLNNLVEPFTDSEIIK